MTTPLAPWICLAGAGAFSLPFDLDNGPPPQLPALTRYEPPSFPESLRLSTLSDGYATMMFTIDADGRVSDSIAIEASHPAFETAMQETFAKWRFEFAASATTPRREFIQFDFRRKGIVSTLSQRDASKSAFPQPLAEEDKPIRTVAWEQLPQPLPRLEGAMPAYPPDLREQGQRGVASVSFVIDRTGRVRVPVILAASDAQFGTAALDAVRTWKFEPPRYDNERVNVRCDRHFNFGRALP